MESFPNSSRYSYCTTRIRSWPSITTEQTETNKFVNIQAQVAGAGFFLVNFYRVREDVFDGF